MTKNTDWSRGGSLLWPKTQTLFYSETKVNANTCFREIDKNWYDGDDANGQFLQKITEQRR